MIKPDQFKADPYGYLTNQLGHIGLGVLLVFLLSRGMFEIGGEYPVKFHVWSLVASLYLFVVELALQGWRGWDTVEDTIFTVIYGAGVPLYAFREAAPGHPELIVNLPVLDAFFLAAGLHLAAGVGQRLYTKYAARM